MPASCLGCVLVHFCWELWQRVPAWGILFAKGDWAAIEEDILEMTRSLASEIMETCLRWYLDREETWQSDMEPARKQGVESHGMRDVRVTLATGRQVVLRARYLLTRRSGRDYRRTPGSRRSQAQGFYPALERLGFMDRRSPRYCREAAPEWNVNCQAVGSGTASIKYLAPYVFKVAISGRRIVKVEDHTVFFRYKKPRSTRWRTMALDVMEFMRRFLQHVLPTGFMKVRYSGFLSPASPISIENLKATIEIDNGSPLPKPEPEAGTFPPMTCAHCGGTLKYLFSILPPVRIPAAALMPG